MIRTASLPFVLLALATASGGCVYYNGLYNAEVAFREGDDALLRGDVAAARTAWARAADGADQAWEADPDGGWADAALLLAAYSAVRSDDARLARRELAELAALPNPDSASIARARVLEGAVLFLERRPARALEILDDLELSSRDRQWTAEAWLWRARGLAALGRFDEAWAAWDAAAVARPALRPVVEAERVAHAVAADRPVETSVSIAYLLSDRRGEAWADSVLLAADRASRRWGPAFAARLVEPARRDRWGPEARDRVMRRQVGLLLAAGDTSGADATLAVLAEGTTETAVTSRVDLARLRLARSRTFSDLVPIRRVLLPVADDPRARDLMLRLVETELLAGWGVEGDVLAWFSSGEVARDELGSPGLAGALFLTAAESDADGRWTGKMLLAALTVLGERELRDRIRRRALGRQFDPWMDRLTPGYPASGEFRRRETELADRVRDLRRRAAVEAERGTAHIDPENP